MRLYVVEHPKGGTSYIEANSLREARESHDRSSHFFNVPVNRLGDPTYQRPDPTNVTYAVRIRLATAKEADVYWARKAETDIQELGESEVSDPKNTK